MDSRLRGNDDEVGWVERSETHHHRQIMMGFAALYPSYKTFLGVPAAKASRLPVS